MDIINVIIKLKNDGFKNNEIAEKLNIPVGTVKSKLFRNKNQAVKEVSVEPTIETFKESSGYKCKGCGCDIKVVIGKKRRQFCSDYCRVKYWRKHKNECR